MNLSGTINPSIQMVGFQLGNEEYGMDILKIREIVRLQPITHLPECQTFVEGVINLRGVVIPVIDLKRKLGLGKLLKNDQTRIMVISVENKILGVLVDRVEKVRRILPGQIENAHEIGLKSLKEYIAGVGKLDNGLLIILDIDKVLTQSELEHLEEIEKIKDAVIDHTRLSGDSGHNQDKPAQKSQKPSDKSVTKRKKIKLEKSGKPVIRRVKKTAPRKAGQKV